MSKRNTQRRKQDWSGYWFVNVGDEGGKATHRSWDDCRRYGFLQAGGGEKWSQQIRRLQPGDRVFAYNTGHGYVGFGKVVTEAVPQSEFQTTNGDMLTQMPLLTPPDTSCLHDPGRCDWCVRIQWSQTLDRDQAVLKKHARRGTAKRHHKQDAINDLLKAFE